MTSRIPVGRASVAGLVMATAVAGCGGSSTGGAPSFGEMSARFTELEQAAAAQPLTSDMPVAGSARYFGRGDLRVGNTPSAPDSVMFGRVALRADFASAQISGTMTDIRDQDNAPVPGTLTVSTGGITGNTVAQVDLDGTLTMDGVDTVFDLAGTGEFRGPQARFFRADHAGTATDGTGTRSASGSLVVREPQQ